MVILLLVCPVSVRKGICFHEFPIPIRFGDIHECQKRLLVQLGSCFKEDIFLRILATGNQPHTSRFQQHILMSTQNKVDVKVVLLGASDAGKTCLLARFQRGIWQDKADAVCAFRSISLTNSDCGRCLWISQSQCERHRSFTRYLGKYRYPILFWLTKKDTAGSERFEAITRVYYRSARAAVVCYGKVA